MIRLHEFITESTAFGIMRALTADGQRILLAVPHETFGTWVEVLQGMGLGDATFMHFPDAQALGGFRYTWVFMTRHPGVPGDLVQACREQHIALLVLEP